MPCEHKNVRFLACTAADRLPGVFVCDDCEQKFTQHPNKPSSVRYLEEPNAKATKTCLPLVPSKH